jgi:hypothetical protein
MIWDDSNIPHLFRYGIYIQGLEYKGMILNPRPLEDGERLDLLFSLIVLLSMLEKLGLQNI